MANQLKMAKIRSILTLHQQGWSQRRIAEELGIHRETVGRYIAAAGSKPAKAPPGSEVQNQPQAPPGSEAENRPAAPSGAVPSRSDCEAYREQILEKLGQGLSAKRIHQDLAGEAPELSYYSVRRFVQGITAVRPLPFRRLETAPGEQAQVDFGTGAPVLQANGRTRHQKGFCLRMPIRVCPRCHQQVLLPTWTADGHLGTNRTSGRQRQAGIQVTPS